MPCHGLPDLPALRPAPCSTHHTALLDLGWYAALCVPGPLHGALFPRAAMRLVPSLDSGHRCHVTSSAMLSLSILSIKLSLLLLSTPLSCFIFLHNIECSWHMGSVPYSWGQGLIHSRCSVNVFWMNGWKKSEFKETARVLWWYVKTRKTLERLALFWDGLYVSRGFGGYLCVWTHWGA